MRLFALASVIPAVFGCGPSNMSAPWAVSEDVEGAAFVGRYVGGGTHFGRERLPDEGTWCRDYSGLDSLKVIELRWADPPESNPQGGIGSY